jgi:hypothetical protein
MKAKKIKWVKGYGLTEGSLMGIVGNRMMFLIDFANDGSVMGLRTIGIESYKSVGIHQTSSVKSAKAMAKRRLKKYVENLNKELEELAC